MSEAKVYRPDDSGVTVEALAFLYSNEGTFLRHRVAAILQDGGQLTVADITRLRKDFPPNLVHAAIVIESFQPAARHKFPEFAGNTIWAVPEALEQATDSAVARHKAQRFDALNPAGIFDLCAGIGGDALALAAIAPTTAIDLSPVRLQCLRYNLESTSVKNPLETRTADIASVLHPQFPIPNFQSPQLFHLDPARRSAGKRSPAYADLIPGPPLIEKLIRHFPGGALKLSPAVDFDTLPMEGGGHLELISHNRAVVQAVLWIGQLSANFPPQTRTATTLVDHIVTGTFTAAPQAVHDIPAAAPPPGTYLYEVDGAFTRAALAAPLAEQLQLTPLTIDAGYLCALHANERIAHHALTAFQVLAASPFSEKRILEMLASLPPAAPGPVEVKTRGRIAGIDTDFLQKRFSAASPFRRTVLIYKCGSKTLAVAANRTHDLHRFHR